MAATMTPPPMTNKTITESSPASTPPESPAGGVEARWHVWGGAASEDEVPHFRPRRWLIQLLLGVLVVLLVVSIGGAVAARRLAERESVNDAAARAGILADAVISPALTPGLQKGDPAAIAQFDTVVRGHVLGDDIVRVKIWSASGTVLYADEPQLIGRTFTLDAEQREAIRNPTTHASVSDLGNSENAFETGQKLVEVYRPVWFPDRSVGLFEIYTSYDPVGIRTSQLWRGFAGITASSLIVLLLLLTPLGWHLFGQVRRYEGQRRRWLERAVNASSEERRRIAGTLHDGPVQELAAASFTVSGAAAKAARGKDPDLATELEGAASSVRSGIRALRGLLGDIYPAALMEDGLAAGLESLAQTSTTATVNVHCHLDPDAEEGLTEDQQRLLFRIAQETVRNAVKHAGPATVTIALAQSPGLVTVDVVDDGIGFDPTTARTLASGHLGLQVISDLADSPGLRVEVSSAPGRGTHWRMTQEVPQ